MTVTKLSACPVRMNKAIVTSSATALASSGRTTPAVERRPNAETQTVARIASGKTTRISLNSVRAVSRRATAGPVMNCSMPPAAAASSADRAATRSTTAAVASESSPGAKCTASMVA